LPHPCLHHSDSLVQSTGFDTEVASGTGVSSRNAYATEALDTMNSASRMTNTSDRMDVLIERGFIVGSPLCCDVVVRIHRDEHR
jgi:hypothetical protein